MDTTYKNDRTNLEKLFESGCNYYEAGDKAKALNIWKEAAELGYPKAQHFVAVCYHSGIGTEKDKIKPWNGIERLQHKTTHNLFVIWQNSMQKA